MAYSLEQLETDSAHHYTPKSALQHVLSLLSAERADLIVVVIYAVAIGVLSLAVPIGVQTLVNIVAFGSVFQPVVVLTLVVLVLMGLSGALKLIQIWLVEVLQRRLFVRIALDLARRIPRFHAVVFRQEWPADLINRFFEVVLVQKTIAKIFLEGISVLLQAVIGLLILTFYHPFLLVFVLLVLLSLVCNFLFLGRGAIKTSMSESSAKHTVLIWLENLAAHPLLFKSHLGREYALQRADRVTAKYVRTRMDHFRILMLQNIGFVVLQTVASAALLGLGGYLVIQEELTLGQLVASEIIVSGVLASFTKLGKLLESFYDLVASIAKLDSLIELPTENNVGDDLEATGQSVAVSISGLSAQFSGNRVVFNNLKLNLEPGDKVAVYGGNGSGKSLLADLLMKFHVSDSGKLLLNKQNIEDLNPLSIRSQVKLVRGVEAFRGTIEDNLKMGREDILKRDIRDALASVGMGPEIEMLKDGLDTWLREDGRPLSSGQVTRLMIARALLMKPGLLIIDELLDTIDEKKLDDCMLPTLLSSETKCTVLVMTHDSRLAAKFEQHYFLSDGTLKEGIHG